MLTPRLRWLGVLVVALFLIFACNFPRAGAPTPAGPDVDLTYAAQTVEAQLTLSAGGLQPTFTIPATGGYPPPGGTQLPPAGTVTPQAMASPTAVEVCDRAGFVKDVTYPDNSFVDLGAKFTKTWQLKNTGTCTWTSQYQVVFDRGDAMSAPAAFPLTDFPVSPGETVDVSVDLVAPENTGTYQGFFRLRSPSGIFGLGEKGDKEFWVKIRTGVASGITFDFIARASSATWIASGGGSEVTLAFGGADDDPNGVAKIKDGITLENGQAAGKTLITHPKHNDDGRIAGTFSEHTIRNGEHFKAKLGFLEGCGIGEVIHRLQYKEGGETHTLGEWDVACDGKLTVVDVDLSHLDGKKVQFVLLVLADGSPEDDLAIWGSARIER